jgi:hypothetical protein
MIERLGRGPLAGPRFSGDEKQAFLACASGQRVAEKPLQKTNVIGFVVKGFVKKPDPFWAIGGVCGGDGDDFGNHVGR